MEKVGDEDGDGNRARGGDESCISALSLVDGRILGIMAVSTSRGEGSNNRARACF